MSRSKKTSKLRVTGLCEGNSQWCHIKAISFQITKYATVGLTALFRLTTTHKTKLHITGPLWWESTSDNEPIMWKTFPCAVTLSWRWSGRCCNIKMPFLAVWEMPLGKSDDLQNGISYTNKMTSWYKIKALILGSIQSNLGTLYDVRPSGEVPIWLRRTSSRRPARCLSACRNRTPRTGLLITEIIALGPFYLQWSTLIPAWISHCVSCQVWDEIIYPYLPLKFGNG